MSDENLNQENLNQIGDITKANNASVLIVDDTIYNIQLLSLMLNKQGYRVEKATSGTEALESANRLLPDIILLDIRMPDIDGYEVCKRLKANPVTTDIPIIFISSIEETSDKVEAFSVGGVDYISKPFQLIEVLARIETHLRLCSLQKKLQEQNEQLQSSALVLSRSLEQERELSQMKSDFISVVSHEFRTPLTTIQSASELLEYYEWTKEEQVEQLHQIQSEVKHMTDLMEDVLFLSRANANKAKLNITKFDLADFCKRLLVQMKKAFAENYILYSFLEVLQSDIAIKNFHHGDGLPIVSINMDQKLLRQIITNLMTNAIKYSDQNSTIEFRVSVDFNVSFPNVKLVISDRGIGIPEEDLEHLFSAFHRGKNVGILPGTGLGLSIVKNCIDIHNGTIAVNSKLNVGTIFTVTLPI
jgi:signal transduction histidine kinase